MTDNISNLKNSALLVMDFQNLLVDNYLSSENAKSILNNAASLISTARNSAIPVIYVTVGFRSGYPEVHARNNIFSAAKEHGVFEIGSEGSAICTAIWPLDDEPVVVKHRIGAFSFTDLEMILRAKNIETLILTGVTTSGVVLSTVRQAFDLDYNLIVVSDCCADSDAEHHDFLIKKTLPQHAKVVLKSEIVRMIGGNT